MRPSTFVGVWALAVFLSFLNADYALAGDFFKWVDDDGVTHFADSVSEIPPKYRKQVEEKSFKKPPEKSTVRSESGGATVYSSDAPEKGKKLARYEIPYKPYGGLARRIIIPVTFNGSLTVPMALDTGAPGMVIKPGVAERLGLYDKDTGMLKTFSGGIGGAVPAARTIIDSVQVGGVRGEFVPTTIVEMNMPYFEGLVGMDFIANYSLEIDTARRVLVFTELPQRSRMPAGHDEAWWRLNFYEFSSYLNFWREYEKYLKKRESNTTFTGQTLSNIKRLQAVTEKQKREAEKLFQKLEYYASHHSVPMEWRRY